MLGATSAEDKNEQRLDQFHLCGPFQPGILSYHMDMAGESRSSLSVRLKVAKKGGGE